MVEQYQDFMGRLTKDGFYNQETKKIRCGSKRKAVKEKYQQYLDELKNITSWANKFEKKLSVTDRMRFVRFDITEENGVCPVDGCNQLIKFEPGRMRYYITCGANDIQHKKFLHNWTTIKSKESLKEKYGVEHALQKEEFKRKQVQTTKERFGVEHAAQNKEILQKMKQTTKERFGVEHAAQNKEILQKMKQTTKERYGVEHAAQNKEILQKTKETNLQKYGASNYTQSVQYKEKLPEIKEKTIDTNLQKYGVPTYFQSVQYKEKLPEIKEKTINTNLEKYGASNYTQSDTHKAKIYNFENYKKLSKEFIEENFLDENKNFDFRKFTDFIDCSQTTAYKILHKFGVNWNYGLGGFDPNKPGILYYIKHNGLYKIGITNKTLEERFGKYFKEIEVIKTWYYENGQEAYLAEQEILTAFGYYRIINESWSEEIGGRTEFFDNDVLQLDS